MDQTEKDGTEKISEISIRKLTLNGYKLIVRNLNWIDQNIA